MSEEPLPPAKPYVPPPVIIPPPVISAPPPPPPSPMASSSAGTAAAPAVKVKIRDADDAVSLTSVSINSRIIAAFIDVLVVAGIMILAALILPDILSKIAWLAGLAYMIVRDSLPFLDGQSVGKKVMKLRVTTLDDQPLTKNWEKALIRNVILVIPLLNLVELAVLLMRDGQADRGRRLGDEWAKTKVVAVIPPTDPSDSV